MKEKVAHVDVKQTWESSEGGVREDRDHIT